MIFYQALPLPLGLGPQLGVTESQGTLGSQIQAQSIALVLATAPCPSGLTAAPKHPQGTASTGGFFWGGVDAPLQVSTCPTAELPWTVQSRSFCLYLDIFSGSEWLGNQCRFAGITWWEGSGSSALHPKDNI